MKIRLNLVLSFTLACAAMSAALNVGAAEFGLSATGDEPLYQTTLSKEVYHASQGRGLSDLTLQNASGEQVPYALLDDAVLHPNEVKNSTQQALKWFPLSEKAMTNTQQLQLALGTSGNSTQLNIQQHQATTQEKTVYLVDAGKGHADLHTLLVDWQGEDGQFITVEVLASDDLKDWNSVGQGVLLKTTSQGNTILQNTITMDYANQARYYQLVPQGVAGELFKLTSVKAHYQRTTQVTGRALWQDLTWLSRSEDGKGQVNVDYEAMGHYPATAIQVALPEQNTITNVHVLVRNNANDPWMLLSAASLYRTVKQGKPVNNPDIVIRPHEARFWRLQFHQASGGIGQQNPGLRVGWAPQTVVWNARGQAPYTLQVGHQPSMSNVLALDDLMPHYTQEKLQQLPKAALTFTANASVSASPTQSAWVSPPDYKRWLLWAGLLVGVLVLAGMAWSLLKTTNKESA